MSTYYGSLDAEGLRLAVILPRFNDFIGHKLLEGALDAIVRHNGSEQNVDIIRVPGALEIPQVARWLLQKDAHDAVIALGVVIRGSTYHFDIVANESAKGLAKLAIEYDCPVIFGIVTADSLEQAIERAGTKLGNKGFDAAMAAIEMCQLKRQLHKAK